MPRKAKPASVEVLQARDVVAAYLKNEGMTETSLAQATGVRQYTISRLLTGRLKNLTTDAETVASYAIYAMNEKYPGSPLAFAPKGSRSDEALRKVHEAAFLAWDGTTGGADLLADLLNALTPVLHKHAPPA